MGYPLHRDESAVAASPSFPALEHEVLDRWAAETAISSGELATARFLLAVWDPGHSWRCGRFDLMEALRLWNSPDRNAFLSWALDPWWP